MSRKTIITAIAAIIAFSPSAAFAQWSNPTAAPTSANASAPLNVSASGQSKAGGLIVNTGGATYGLIVQSGKVGIDTTNPENNLDITVNQDSNAGIYVRNTSTGGSGESSILLGPGITSTPWNAGGLSYRGSGYNASGHVNPNQLELNAWSGATNGLLLRTEAYAPMKFVTNNVERMRITADGNVGIGNTAPTYKLEVNGNIAVDAGGGFYYASDRRLKTDIAPLPSALDNVLKLQGVSFTWKDSGKKSVGLIAQDVEKVYPELVGTNPTTGIKSVEYGNLVAPLIEAVKAQQKEIDALKQQVADLKAAR